MYEELVGALRKRAMDLPEKFSRNAVNIDLLMKAADAIESTNKAYQMISEAYEAEVTKQNWIPVTEALPKKPQDYPNCKLREYYFLVTLETNAVVCREYDFDNKRWPGTIRVTHWMPLPEPPKEVPTDV